MSTNFIGRVKEKAVLMEAFNSDEPEMVSVIGRRRVGKTFLIRTAFEDKIDFEISGLQNTNRTDQLRNFAERMKEYFPKAIISQPPKDWLDAFFLLIEHLKQKPKKEKLVVFLDEIPWMATHKSGFLRGLSYFWNSWAVRQKIVVVLCGSAASWMIQKILRNKGGLHNRVTRRLRLKSFTLSESKNYLESKNIHFDHYQLLQLYMAMGGIPHYLKEIKAGKSAVQNINRICFQEDGLLKDEFLSLYPALFQHADYHEAIIRVLSTKQNGMSRKEILAKAKLPEGGRVTKVLEELKESGFITFYAPFGKQKKDKIIRLTDEYSLFYLRFIENNNQSENAWMTLSQTQSYKIWCGYAFENTCLKHIEQIKKAMQIGGVYSTSSSFLKQGSSKEDGTQIDLIIDRNDHIINLIETKFYNTEFSITKDYAHKLRERIRIFQTSTKTKKQLQMTLLTTFGLKPNKHSIGLVETHFGMDILFED